LTPKRYTEIQACRICGNPTLDPVFHLGEQALTGVFPKIPAAQAALTRGPLELVKCREERGGAACGLLQLRQSYAPGEMYGANYGYRSSLNRSMVEHLHGKVRALAARVDLGRGDLVVDIGSNDATLLKGYPDLALRRIGIDPTAAKFRQFYPPDVELVTDFFSAKAYRALAGDRKAKVVTSIAMFYDLERPLDFMRELKEILAPDGVWVFEQSYMPSMLRTSSYDTICHEHIEYYGLTQIKWLLDRAGLRLLDVELNDVNGGSFSVVAGHPDGRRAADETAVARVLSEEHALRLDTLAPYAAFRDRALRHREELTAFVRGANARG
jgi:NDP-4-keto-2,6-dideoxyhexose 3-C-methyltransferase